MISVLSLLIGFLLGVLLMIVYIPVVLIEMGCCGCLGTVKETALKVAFEASELSSKLNLNSWQYCCAMRRYLGMG